MPGGKPGDHPLTDLLVHGIRAFPPDMEEMIRRLHNANRKAFDEPEALQLLCQWENGENLDEGRKWLRRRLGIQDT
ncbi:hypothetical protein C5Y96_14420 [Blastopirellula marina]|uniref:Uncharacterized protein n=1 Tax=Blastopirellula marina TaxID=124 RepID=A0A2S8FET7_9BACT|nr:MULTISPECIES: hypothetical protein [Pirellulaceae]PQO30657.1 hypothetical protein C5Y96_14420 [Blastopirellula marina]RCS50794.1 hypothetical protein DTL36_14430 [Bremerella cremea]